MLTRDQVLHAAVRRLNSDPTTSMADLAAAIGISRATLNRHFASRDALLREIGERSLDHWDRSQRESGMAEAAESGDPEAIRDCLRELTRWFVENAEEFAYALANNRLEAMPELVERADVLADREVEFYAAAQRAGVLRSDVPARWIEHTIYGLMIAAREGLRRGDVARRDLEGLVLSTFLTGTGATPTASERQTR
ncbi:transcriptional regulator, TetR family [Kribbella flavida DSM 17836]|uniref:Transcriptional regulator, TetR family n=1 Tax=Kribbella flavida (strain DSM 17836 / JCM 10339 / NBRC 14399) TaxID=479435 RepID=D2PVG8_KRIFD|nr:TetR/AcrR family transcriptional regulator [Kribbella flavida]ADB35208.1 transcriptional regulator, TetR family [Kribbella flavida DSM 17836]